MASSTGCSGSELYQGKNKFGICSFWQWCSSSVYEFLHYLDASSLSVAAAKIFITNSPLASNFVIGRLR